jgi:hypothetical protein
MAKSKRGGGENAESIAAGVFSFFGLMRIIRFGSHFIDE